MQRAPQRPGADDGAIGERLLDERLGRALRAKSQRPQRPGIVLRLHGAEPRDHFGRRRKARTGEALRAEPLLCYSAAFARRASASQA